MKFKFCSNCGFSEISTRKKICPKCPSKEFIKADDSIDFDEGNNRRCGTVMEVNKDGLSVRSDMDVHSVTIGHKPMKY